MGHLGESILSFFIGFFQVDKATSDLKNTNVRLKDTVNQVIYFLSSSLHRCYMDGLSTQYLSCSMTTYMCIILQFS